MDVPVCDFYLNSPASRCCDGISSSGAETVASRIRSDTGLAGSGCAFSRAPSPPLSRSDIVAAVERDAGDTSLMDGVLGSLPLSPTVAGNLCCSPAAGDAAAVVVVVAVDAADSAKTTAIPWTFPWKLHRHWNCHHVSCSWRRCHLRCRF